MYSYIHLFMHATFTEKYLLNDYYMGTTVLGAGDTEMNRADRGPEHMEFIVWWGKQALKKS